MAGIAFAFGILGIVISLAIYLALVYTFRKIRDVKSTVGYTVIPYTVALFASAIWLYYGAIRLNAITLVIINNIGCMIEMAYVVIFFYYSGDYDRVRAVRTHSVYGIPITLTCVLTGNAVIWGIYGFAKGDANTWLNESHYPLPEAVKKFC
ncbi:PREDICTED: bidirectional sugar transporter N3-like [Erythranthe guttata]|uniref:bidirectional sugar transporter N3-like n=1 Tax=Erythranthe guttata TaxID=4155 RepID=UPI00064DD905|nr:PREDICTED: bidirectional sugar transporter N3-like [Erythranthe guttata]|eukprot:XP_012832637.1 PREDICTED: bidirectional sugar transporter N3-like [Erythranthe guttata]